MELQEISLLNGWLHVRLQFSGCGVNLCEANQRNLLEVPGFLGNLANQEDPATSQAYQIK